MRPEDPTDGHRVFLKMQYNNFMIEILRVHVYWGIRLTVEQGRVMCRERLTHHAMNINIYNINRRR